MNRIARVRAAALFAFAGLALPLAAEPAPAPAPETAPAAKPEAEPLPSSWYDRLIDRYRERLNLTDEQVGSIRQILTDTRKRAERSRQQTETAVREVLNDTQKAKLDELQKSDRSVGPFSGSAGTPGRDGHSGGSPSRFGGGRWFGPSADDLQRDLALTDEQREKVDAILRAAMEGVRARIEEARAGGGPPAFDWQAMRTEIEKLFNENAEKIKAVLTPDQQEKFGKLVEDRRRMMQGLLRRGDEHVPPEERAARAMEALKIEDAEEGKAVKTLVARVAKLQDDLTELDRTVRDKARDLLKAEGMTDDAVETKLQDLRKERRAVDEPLQHAQDELRQVVSPKQELALIQLGLLK